MTKPMTFDGTETRPMNDTEYERHLADLEEVEAQTKADLVKAEARQAVLDKLGLTQDEAQALLG